MSQEKEARITEIWGTIASLEKQRDEGPVSETDKGQISAKLVKLNTERARIELELQAEEQAEREQKVQANIATYTDTLGEIFEVLFPAETYEKALGLTEYGEKRTQYYQLQQAYYSEGLESVNVAHEVELAKKDERIQGWKESADLLNEDLKAANNRTRSAEEDVNHWIEKYNESEKENVEITDALNVTKGKLNEIEQKYSELEQRVLDANKQVLEIAGQRDDAIDKFNKLHASQTKIVGAGSTLKELMGDIKTKNQTEPDEWLKRFNERQKDASAKLELPEIIQQEQPSPEITSADAGSNQVLAAESTVEAPTFQTIAAPALGSIQISGQPVDGGVPEKAAEEYITRGEFNERLAELEARITGEKAA